MLAFDQRVMFDSGEGGRDRQANVWWVLLPDDDSRVLRFLP